VGGLARGGGTKVNTAEDWDRSDGECWLWRSFACDGRTRGEGGCEYVGELACCSQITFDLVVYSDGLGLICNAQATFGNVSYAYCCAILWKLGLQLLTWRCTGCLTLPARQCEIARGEVISWCLHGEGRLLKDPDLP
jgi:hypothetical protein